MSSGSRPIIGYSTFALCSSLTLHVALFAVMVGYYAQTAEQIRLPAIDRTPEARAELQTVYLPHAPMPAEQRLGRRDGTGTAVDDSPGELEMLTRQGEQDQSFLSRDPEGPGKMHAEPSESLAPVGSGGDGGGGAAGPNLPFGVAAIESNS